MFNIPFVRLTLLFLCFSLTGCNKEESTLASAEPQTVVSPSDVPAVPKAYIEKGDLDAIRAHGKLRVIAPRFEELDALPRANIPAKHYHQLIDSFAQHQQLTIEWVYVDSFAELIPTLLSGKGDVIATNLTVTQSRAKQISFTRSLNRVDEIIVSSKNTIINKNSDLEGLSIAVREESSFIESLERIAQKDNLALNLTPLTGDLSDTELLQKVAQGEYAATVMDSNEAHLLLPEFPTLQQAITLRSNRAIAWAVRPNADTLLTEINEYLVANALEDDSSKPFARDWDQIQQSGQLRMLTLNNPANYFMWRGELMGFDYDLLKHFASKHKLHLVVTVKEDHQQLIEALKRGEGDVIAASLTASESRLAQGLAFTQPYLKINEQIVAANAEFKLMTTEQLSNSRVGVNPETVYYERFNALSEQGVAMDVVLYHDESTEMLMERLKKGEIDYIGADSHLVAREQLHSDQPLYIFDWQHGVNIVWGLRPDQAMLQSALNHYIKQQYKGLFYNVSFNKYFKNAKEVNRVQQERIIADSALSPFDDIVKKEAAKYGMDWRLVVSQMYQESQFNPKAKSFAGAIGLMQVLPSTAEQLGIRNLTVPENGIEAGVAYMNWLEKRFPGDLAIQERIYFTLAAYNAGTGHVRDARKLAKQQGLDPNRWFDNVEKAMLLLSQKKYYKKARFGYVRGKEPVEYVRKIRDRYLGYIQLQNGGISAD